MAIKRKQVKKDEETLINLATARTRLGMFFEENQKIILGVIGAIVLVVGGWFVYHNLIMQPKEERAMAQMWMAQVQFEQDSFSTALDNPGGGYSGFLKIISDYKGTKAANLSNYYAGISYLNLGNFDAALSFLNDFSPNGIIGPVMKHGALGDVYSELNQMDKAVDNYKKAAEASDNELLTPYYLKKLAMLYETQNDYAKALEIYKRIKSKYPNSNEALSIDKYIARAEAR
ncbi:MAG TPA: tetratricopeptide repeat protein [Saprospiraceae bacterium]|nr:tetratricopeptide repeat protein [Saprospiraceae bacterium]